MEIAAFASDRLQAKISEYNQKKGLTGRAKTPLLTPDAPEADSDTNGDNDDGEPAAPRRKTPFTPIQISPDGLELIEWLSLDCAASEGSWHSDAEIKIDKKAS